MCEVTSRLVSSFFPMWHIPILIQHTGLSLKLITNVENIILRAKTDFIIY